MFKVLKSVAIATAALALCAYPIHADNARSLFSASLKQMEMGKKILTTEYFPLRSIREIDNFENNRAEVIVRESNYLEHESLQVTVSPDHQAIDPSLAVNPENACDGCTFLNVPTAQPFQNGTIEVDVASTLPENAPPFARGFIGIVFRVEAKYASDGKIDAKNSRYEGIYLRPLNSKDNSQLRRNFSVQYISNPGYPWYLLRENSPGMYETYAPLEPGMWTRMRIEVEGTVARLYLNGSLEPTLIVNDLKQGEGLRGAVGLFTEPYTIAYFKNLKITHVP
ncbi:MAG: family 16 glycoside hydrolase [Cyanobacteria bacterium P01_E01_bin.42]